MSQQTPFKTAKPGTKLAGYEVLAEIGEGAASTIYLARDARTAQIYALKHVLKNTPKDQRFIDQAVNEYNVASAIKSPIIRHVPRMIKGRGGLLQLKELFLVMEYVDGVAMEHALPDTFQQAADAFRQTAEGLIAMHAAGFAHADMKPSNVVVNERGKVKIIDLGQACPIGTVKQRIQGTPDYIAPEQVHRRAITEHTDVYNFGATMYWVLTRQNIPTALGDGNSLVDSLDDTLIERAKPVIELNDKCPTDLSELIAECVEVRVENRPEGGMREVRDRLADIGEDLTGTPID